MNMKMEEHEAEIEKNKKIAKKKNRTSHVSEPGGRGFLSGDDIESGSELGKGDRTNDYD
jgi:hypothetical protein